MNKQFANDIISGLSASEKHLSSKYFYDDAGSRIFQEIMQMPEYYLTNSEFEILSEQGQQIYSALQFNEPFNIVELGAGDGSKTFQLLKYLVNKKVDFHYTPIDISQEAIDILSEKLKEKLPQLSIQPKVGDYFEMLKETKADKTPSLLLFLGGNIGNYLEAEALALLQLFYQNMDKGDKLLIGMDIKKNPITIHDAYFDRHGITKRFNINLLKRINREFEADFDIEAFDFYCHYSPETGEVKSYLVSLEDQVVEIKGLKKSFQFQKNELLWTELSKKYAIPEIEQLAETSGFKVLTHFKDSKQYFTDSLWVK